MQLNSYYLFSFYLGDHEIHVGFLFGLFGITQSSDQSFVTIQFSIYCNWATEDYEF